MKWKHKQFLFGEASGIASMCIVVALIVILWDQEYINCKSKSKGKFMGDE